MNLRYIIPIHIWLFWAAWVYYSQQEWIKNTYIRLYIAVLVVFVWVTNLVFGIFHNKNEQARITIKQETHNISQVLVAKNIDVLLGTYWRVYPISSIAGVYWIPIECTEDKISLFRWFSNDIPEGISNSQRYGVLINSGTKIWPLYDSHGCTISSIENNLWKYAEKIDLDTWDTLLLYDRSLSWSVQ
jgi:hypothetical protein